MSLPIRAIVNFVTKDPEVFLGAARNVGLASFDFWQGQGLDQKPEFRRQDKSYLYLWMSVTNKVKQCKIIAGVERDKAGARLPCCKPFP